MARPEKVEQVKVLAAEFTSSSGAVVTDYRGLTVTDAMELRRGLRENDATFVVTKNTLARLAAKKAGLDDLLPMLEGPTAVAFLKGDAFAGAKALLDLTKRFPAVQVKGALVDGMIMDGEQARGLASLDSREVSLGKIAGMLQAPLARMVYLLQAPLARIAFALGEHARQGGAVLEASEPEAAGAPAAEPEAAADAEAPAAEEAAPEAEAAAEPEVPAEEPEAAPEAEAPPAEEPEATTDETTDN